MAWMPFQKYRLSGNSLDFNYAVASLCIKPFYDCLTTDPLGETIRLVTKNLYLYSEIVRLVICYLYSKLNNNKLTFFTSSPCLTFWISKLSEIIFYLRSPSKLTCLVWVSQNQLIYKDSSLCELIRKWHFNFLKSSKCFYQQVNLAP